MANLEWGVKIDGGWFHEDSHRYRCMDGIVRPSSTQVFEILGCTDFSGIPPNVVGWKRSYGNAVHVAGQIVASGRLDWDTVHPAIAPAVTGIELFLQENEFEFHAAEELKIRTLCGMRYGTRLDLRGTIRFRGVRRHVIVDYKTGSKKSKTWDWQLGSYSAEQEKVDGGWIGLVLQVGMDGAIDPWWVLDLERQRREFQVLLSAANLKLNNQMYALGG